MDVFIATPSYDGSTCGEYTTSLCETAIRLSQAGIGIYYALLPGNPFLDMARNELVSRFMDSTADKLLFIDADVGWDAKVVTRILSYEHWITGGLVPKRDPKNDHSYHQNAITGKMSREGLFETLELPTAFMCIDRKAIEKMQESGFGTPEKPFFRIGSAPKDFGEDIYFNRRCAELDIPMWIDSDITFSHTGPRSWRGNFYDHCLETGALIKDKQYARA